jgi:plastocyanin
MPAVLRPSILLALLTAAPAWAAPLALTVQGPDGQPLADAVVAVFVQGAPTQAPAGATAAVAQRKKRFVPGVLAVQTGTAVSFPNFDTVRHHVYSFSPVKVFEIKLYAGTPAAPVVFDKPGTAALGCNIHDTMSAFVRVVDTPYFALTDAEGRASIDLPAGAHQAQVWHPSLPLEAQPPLQPLTSAAGAATLTLKRP